MEMKLARINTGKAVHLVKHKEEIRSGYWSADCGSGYGKQRMTFIGEVEEEKITCKKCLKAYQEIKQEEPKQEKFFTVGLNQINRSQRVYAEGKRK